MSTIQLQNVEPGQSSAGSEPRVLVLPEAASQTFVRGAVVTLVAGYVTAGSASTAAILGFAAEDAHNGATAGLYNVSVYVAESTTVFHGNVTSNGTATTIAVTDVGRVYALYLDTTNKHVYVDKNDTSSNPRAIVQELLDTAGDTSGRVRFKIAGKYRQLDSTSTI